MLKKSDLELLRQKIITSERCIQNNIAEYGYEDASSKCLNQYHEDDIRFYSELEQQLSLKNQYQGLTHPFHHIIGSESFLDRVFQSFWKNFFCSKHIHLFDEVCSLDDHYLYCDCCGLSVHISKIEKEGD